MEFETLFGLPAHPLVVHAAVVLLPLAVVATLTCAVAPSTRRRYAPLALALSLLATAAVGLAQVSGESLEDRVEETPLVEEHTGRGERVLPWALAVSVVAGATTLAPYAAHRRRLSPTALTAIITSLAIVAGAGAAWAVVDVGHSGAKATWNDVEDGEAADR